MAGVAALFAIKDMELMEKISGMVKKNLGWIYPLVLLLYPLRHIRVGAEWWDTGYNYGNFTYMEHMDPMWLLSTYLGNALGHLFTLLPGGGTMLGLNIYTGLIVSLLALGGYLFFTRRVGLPRTLTFWGEMLAVSFCWCPTALLYNYLTYLLLGAGVALLYHALSGDSEKTCGYFLGAGLCLGLNVLVRFPNLAETALILAVWGMALIRRQKPGRTVKQTLQCLAGYLLGLCGGLAVIALRYGPETYVQGIVRLLSMPSEASEYTVYSMVVQQLRNYLQNCIWLGYLVLIMAVGVLVYIPLPRKGRWIKYVGYGACVCWSFYELISRGGFHFKSGIKSGIFLAVLGLAVYDFRKWKLIKHMGYVACVFCGFYYLMLQNMFNLKYSTKLSAFQWGAVLLTATLAVGLVTLLRKNSTEKEKLLCGLGMLVILITPLGSNNHLYSAINNLFLVAPFTLWMLVRFLRWIPAAAGGKRLPGKIGQGGWLAGFFPVKAMLVCILFMITVQGTLFGLGYVFSEGDGGENLHTPIAHNAVLKGMLTSPDRAEIISGLSAYVRQEGLEGREVILYGQIPAMSYYLQMPFAITSWPDLPSYNYEVMVADLERLAGQIDGGQRQKPVLLLEKRPGSYLTEGLEALKALGLNEHQIAEITENPKLRLLEDWIARYGYELCFENEKFLLFLAP